MNLVKVLYTIKDNYPDEFEILRKALDTSEILLEKQTPKIRYSPDKEEDGHFYTKNGFMICRETNKCIRYPLSSFSDLDYCPRCGQKFIEDE